jgi:hypothetical protein
MTDAEILQEIERRLKKWFDESNGGWDEHNVGFGSVQRTIEGLRKNGTYIDWPEY